MNYGFVIVDKIHQTQIYFQYTASICSAQDFDLSLTISYTQTKRFQIVLFYTVHGALKCHSISFNWFWNLIGAIEIDLILQTIFSIEMKRIKIKQKLNALSWCIYAFQMKFYTVHWSAAEITNRQEIKRSRDSKFLHAWKHFLNLWFQTISLEFCFFSELWLRCVFNSSFLFGYSLYFMIECITNGVTFLSFVLALRFISSKNASLSSCWEIVFKKFKLKYFDGKESKTRAKTGMKEGRDKKNISALAFRDIHSLQVEKSTWENARENTPLWSDWNDLQARNLTCSNFKQTLRIHVANGSYIKSISTRLTDVLLCICFWSISIASIWLRLWNRFLCVNYGLSWLVNGWLQFVLAKLIRVFITTQISTAYRAN